MLGVGDIFKIGIGPSSSHTVGPMIIAKRFLDDVQRTGGLEQISRIHVELHGSLALTGHGHGTDRAVILGLAGQEPHSADPDTCDAIIKEAMETHQLGLSIHHRIRFVPDRDIDFAMDIMPVEHPNGMRLTAYARGKELLFSAVYFSLGGGFTCRVDEFGQEPKNSPAAKIEFPHVFESGEKLMAIGHRTELSIAEIMLANEDARRPRIETESLIDNIWNAMNTSVDRGLKTEGILPGGLDVKRRAPDLYKRLTKLGEGAGNEREALFDWLNAYAMAVNEENAAGGRVVTAPTNGAAGVIPSVIRYYCVEQPNATAMIRRFLLTAAAIGLLYKERASISGAEMGCQGEVGVACSMAAAGLAAVWGGTNEEIEHAAEIGMEHNLGLTCDPVNGLVQVPCIERNAIGAVKAANAARLAIQSTGPHRVTLDQVIETMRQTGLDMNSKYKETSQGGLAVNVVEC